MRPVTLPVGLGTSVGPLPHLDPAAAALFVLDHQPRLPALPSLPGRSPLERRLGQAAWGVRGVAVLPDGSLALRPGELEPEAPLGDPDFSGEPYAALRAFVAVLGDRPGPAKFQLTGPVSLGVALHAAGVAVRLAFEVAASVVRQRAQALVSYLARRAPRVAPVVFVDEPSMGAVTDPAFPVSTDAAVDLVSGVLATLEGGATTGLRCGGGADWNVVQGAGPQILATPAGPELVAQAGTLDRFLEGGGWVAWGAVPTEGPMGGGVDRLWRALSGLWCQLVGAGVDPVRLRSQALVTPLGGLGRHHVDQAGQTLDLVDRLAGRLYDQATGLRLSVGA